MESKKDIKNSSITNSKTEINNHTLKRALLTILLFIKQRFDLSTDKEEEHKTIADISRGVEFKGTNLWILIFAIFIASIGLNVNSTAVIIGAMLISPLMGPIMGIGLGAAIIDLDLIKRAFYNLLVAIIISVATSTLYFLITPLREAKSELLARTTPTIWDVLIALFGGLTGIIVGSRKEKSNAIPGVAIATALMPPLCTAGYGIANGQWTYFAGAFYLFFINSVFISLSTFLIVRFLKYPMKKFIDKSMERRVKQWIAGFVIITIIPSVFLAYRIVQEAIFERKGKEFLSKEFHFPQTQIIDKSFDSSPEDQMINITLIGEPLDSIQIKLLRSKLTHYNLSKVTLNIRQGYNIRQEIQMQDSTALHLEDVELMTRDLKISIIKDLYDNNQEVIANKDAKIALLENQLIKNQIHEYPIDDITKELFIQDPRIKKFALSSTPIIDSKTLEKDTFSLAYIYYEGRISTNQKKKLKEFLKVRTKSDSLDLIVW